jgi:hypothetical protein
MTHYLTGQCFIWCAGSRLYCRWTGESFDEARISFRLTFRRHSEASYNATARAWSLPLHVRPRLIEWAYQTFGRDQVCEEWADEGRYRAPRGDADAAIAEAYAVLHLLPSAPAELVAAAHRIAIKQAHPDAGGDHAAAVAINRAAEIIRAHQARAERRSA